MTEDWVAELTGPRREEAQRRLYALLLKAADFEVRRRAPDIADRERPRHPERRRRAARDPQQAPHLPRREPLHDLGLQVRALRGGGEDPPPRLARPRGPARRRLPRAQPERRVETAELLRAIAHAIENHLTPHQREVLVALAVNGVPIDVLAERLDTTRGALYKTLHDARAKLRAYLAAHDHTTVA